MVVDKENAAPANVEVTEVNTNPLASRKMSPATPAPVGSQEVNCNPLATRMVGKAADAFLSLQSKDTVQASQASEDCNVKVMCRFRPINEVEKQENEKQGEESGRVRTQLSFVSNQRVVAKGASTVNYDFDRVFAGDDDQQAVYDGVCAGLVVDFVDGFNATVIAYGQTGSGKTHTMSGAVIPSALNDVFKQLKEKEGTEFTLQMQFMQVYCEEVNDLLAGCGSVLTTTTTGTTGVAEAKEP